MASDIQKMRRQVIFNKACAIGWAIFGGLSFLMGWQNSVALVWFASLYANAKTDWGTAEAADNTEVLEELKANRQELKEARDELKQIREILAGMQEKKMENAPAQEDMERAHRELYTGIAIGGPLNTEDVVSRFPKGVVVVDKPSQKAWIYDYTDDGFLCRDDNGMPLDDEKRWVAAEGNEYDVVVP